MWSWSCSRADAEHVVELRLLHGLGQHCVEEPVGNALSRFPTDDKRRSFGAAPPRSDRDRDRDLGAAHFRHMKVEQRYVEPLADVGPGQRLGGRAGAPHNHAPALDLQLENFSRFVSLSSTISRRLPARGACVPRDAPPGSPVTAAGTSIVKWKLLPCPGPALSSHIEPPMSSTSRLLIARPRPVPPYLRAMAASTWEKDLNSRCLPSSLMPIPVSRTMK